ncbi:MAG TPA: 2TM domain-containing protein [Candidatus Saccharimonadales bacterium]|nr:2TM domain-containing protein [Candidatus Saccharimonadales bacterium]
MTEASGATTATGYTTDTANARAAAVRRLSARRDFMAHVVAFVVVNAGLVAIWLATGHGYFWPAWVLGAWAIGLVLHAWDVYGRTPITDEEIRQEMERQARRNDQGHVRFTGDKRDA